MDWKRSLFTRAMHSRCPHLALQILLWGAPALSAGPMRLMKRGLYSTASSLGKGCKGKGQVLPEFELTGMELLHWKGKTTMPAIFSSVHFWQCSHTSLLGFYHAQKWFGVFWKSCKQSSSNILAFIVTKQSQKTGSWKKLKVFTKEVCLGYFCCQLSFKSQDAVK